MKIRTILYLLIGAIVVAALSVLYNTNREILNQSVIVGQGIEMPVWVMILAVSGISMLVPLLFGLLRDLRRMFSGLTARRKVRSQQEAEERYLIGIESRLNGREERALEHFEAVLAIEPNHFQGLMKAGEVLCSMRRYAEAIEYHRRASRAKESDLRPLYALVSDYEESGATENAKAILNRVITQSPKKSLAAYMKFRDILMNEAAWDKAWEIQQRIENLLREMSRSSRSEKKYHLGIRYMLAQRLIEQGREREAIGILRRLARTEPTFVPAHLRLGKALIAIGQPEEAVDVWDQGYQATSHPIFLTTTENYYLHMEQPRRAIEALQSAIVKSKKDIIPRFFLGKLYYRLEMIDEALEQFSQLKGHVTYFPALHYYLAKTMERHGNYRDALRELETVLRQAEVLKVEYACGTCNRKFPDWVDHCSRCGEWNSVQFDFREERPVEELGLPTAPVYTVESQEG